MPYAILGTITSHPQHTSLRRHSLAQGKTDILLRGVDGVREGRNSGDGNGRPVGKQDHGKLECIVCIVCMMGVVCMVYIVCVQWVYYQH